MIVDYIESHRDRFGVEPICTVLSEHGQKIASSTYLLPSRRWGDWWGKRDDSHLFVIWAPPRPTSGMTRGRHRNVAHLVAESVDDARSQWVDVFNRDRADLGPEHAAERAADDLDRYGPSAPPPATGLQAAMLRDGPWRPPQPIPVSPPTSRGIGR